MKMPNTVCPQDSVLPGVLAALPVGGVTVDGGTGNNINMTAGSATVSDGILITPAVVQCEYVGALP